MILKTWREVEAFPTGANGNVFVSSIILCTWSFSSSFFHFRYLSFTPLTILCYCHSPSCLPLSSLQLWFFALSPLAACCRIWRTSLVLTSQADCCTWLHLSPGPFIMHNCTMGALGWCSGTRDGQRLSQCVSQGTTSQCAPHWAQSIQKENNESQTRVSRKPVLGSRDYVSKLFMQLGFF
jgi:hypothetical protein